MRARWKFLGLAATLATLVSCGSLLQQHAWNERDRGLVIPHDTFPADCSLCHVSGSWNKLRDDFEYDHFAETGVPLFGAHAEAQCLRCHNDRGPVAIFASQGCSGCHEDIHRGRLGPQCDDCHGQEDWRPSDAIAMHASTRFPLVGPHASAECFTCHEGAQVGNFEGAQPECEICHLADATAVTDPDHVANGWVADCQRCHSQLSFVPARFEHPASFPLTNSHGGLACDACHLPGTFAGLSTDCASCHINDYNATTDPNHATAGFSTDCVLCHNTSSWGGADFIHTPSFPLVGGHDSDQCSLCHQNGVFIGTPTDCVACHLADYNGTSDPNHATSGFSTNCVECHDVFGWGNANFVHTPTFPLTGGHDLTDCSLCHAGGVFAGTPTDCAACHLPEYNATANPDHAAAGFPTDCSLCHNTAAWPGASFVHTPAFQLVGGHSLPECNACHAGGVYAGTPSDCAACHIADYNNTTAPNHATSGFPTDCVMCHDVFDWANGVFNHPFPINSGAHSGLDCIDCHTVPAATPAFSCIDCHQHNRTQTDNDHSEVPGYVYSSPACLSCHPNGRR